MSEGVGRCCTWASASAVPPMATNATPAGRERNRRVDFTLFTSDQNPEIPSGSLIRDIEAFNDSTFAIICNGKVPFELDEYENPPRLSVDLPGIYYIRDSKSKNTFELNSGLVKRARVAYHTEGYTRVVFDLVSQSVYSARQVDDAVVITISAAGANANSDMTKKN